MNACGVCAAGDATTLRELCADVRELDLAENHVREWTEVRQEGKRHNRNLRGVGSGVSDSPEVTAREGVGRGR